MGQIDLVKRLTNRQALFGLVAAAVLVLTTFSSLMVSADAISAHSIQASTASISAPAGSVSYTVTFTPEENAGAFVIDFCSTTPLLGQGCTPAPTGLDVSSAATATAGFAVLNTADSWDDNTIVASKTMAANTPETVVFTGITNPDTAGVVYARIVTYATTAEAEDYLSTDPENNGAVPVDYGSVAMYFNESITVSGTVLETLEFCVSSTAIGPACAGAEDDLSSLVLGEEQGVDSGIFALTTGMVHQKSLFTQINTNAANGAVVRLRSSAACGGLLRVGTAECDIAGALNTDVTTADAKFGVKLTAAAAASGSTNATGTLKAAADSMYDTAAFKFNFIEGGATGVTSTLGDPFLDTNGAPAADMNMELIFGATVTNDTPAGTYSTDLNMIAVGKF